MYLSPVTLVVLATLSKLMVFATVSLWPSPPIPSFLHPTLTTRALQPLTLKTLIGPRNGLAW